MIEAIEQMKDIQGLTTIILLGDIFFLFFILVALLGIGYCLQSTLKILKDINFRDIDRITQWRKRKNAKNTSEQ